MNVEKLKQLKKDAGYTNQMVAEESGVPLGTVQKIFSGETKAPRYKTLKAIEDVLISVSGYEAELQIAVSKLRGSGDVMPDQSAALMRSLRTNDAVVKNTIGDADNLMQESDGRFDNTFVDLAADDKSDDISAAVSDQEFDDAENKESESAVRVISFDDEDDCHPKNKSMLNKLMAVEIILVIKEYMKENGISGYMLGTDAVIELDDPESMETEKIYPDVALIMDRAKIKSDRIEGAPELVIEIMNSGTRSRHIANRPDMYRDAGVKEYWMIDVDAKNIMAYAFEEQALPTMYGFSGRVPVKVLGGDCQVNFAQLYGRIGFLFDR